LVVSLGASYAVGDVFGLKHSLHRRWSNAPAFYGTFASIVGVATAIVLTPGAPLGIVTTAVQALAGVLLPSALVFLLLLCNDQAVLGPWTNSRWLNALATASIGLLLTFSALLTLTTILPGVDIKLPALALVGVLATVLAILARMKRGRNDQRPCRAEGLGEPKAIWTMPPLATLPPPAPSSARSLGLVVLRLYLTIAVALLVVKTVELIIAS
jgi:hypothetical protein